MDTPFIPILLGTNRQDRRGVNVANLLYEEIQKRDDLTTNLIDVRDFDLPKDDYGPNLKEKFPTYIEEIIKADGLIITVPEYNHGYPGILKSVLDLAYEEYGKKVVGIAGISKGPWGGIRVCENILPVLKALGLVPIKQDLNFPLVEEIFDENGKLTDNSYLKRIKEFTDELIWMAKVLKWGRENL